MTDAPETEGSLAAELHNLGKNLKSALHVAWESEDRKKLQQEIEAGLTALGNVLSETVTEFRQSPTGQRLKAEGEALRDRLRSGEMGTRARDDLVALLRKINVELEKAGAGSDQSEADSSTTAEGETPRTDVPASQSR